jgi:hypothetical protein
MNLIVPSTLPAAGIIPAGNYKNLNYRFQKRRSLTYFGLFLRSNVKMNPEDFFRSTYLCFTKYDLSPFFLPLRFVSWFVVLFI